MEITCNAKVEKPLLSFSTAYRKCSKEIMLFSIVFVCAMASALLVSIYDIYAQAQEPSNASNRNIVFRVNVQVFNSANVDHVGTVHVYIDNTNISEVLNGATFPSKSNVYQIFEFNSTDVPVGKGFTVEIIYGDDKFKRSQGLNTPAKEPEIVQMTIP